MDHAYNIIDIDKRYSLDSKDDFRSGCRNVSHQQQIFVLGHYQFLEAQTSDRKDVNDD